MKLNKKRSYFVSADEFKEVNRNPFMAGILSIITGMFGGHRFYLHRKLTGFIFLVLSVFSIGAGDGILAFFLVILTAIEGMVYIVKGIILWGREIKEKIVRKNGKKEELISDEGESTIELEENQRSEAEETGSLEIIEVSNIETSKIPIENELANPFKPNWITRLSIPYERDVMRVPQVKQETLSLYKDLCVFIDAQLRNNKSSLNREVKRIERKAGHYSNILYTIYCISEGHITKGYSGGYSYYDPEFSYQLLEEHLGRDLKDRVLRKAKEREKNLPFPDSRTREYFRLTKNGFPMEWWDRDGKLRSERDFNEEELNILRLTPARRTKVWKVYAVKKQIIELYLIIWETILNSFKEDLRWKKNNRAILEEIRNGRYAHYLYYERNNILASLIKISENAIREVMPNTQILNTSKEKNNIENYLPSELVEDINKKITEYKATITDQDLKDIIRDMLEDDPSNWRLKVEDILIQDNDEKIARLIDYSEDKDFVKMAKQIIENTEDEKLLLLCLYGIEKKEELSQNNVELLESIIHPSNIPEYRNIVKSNKKLSLVLLNRLLELKKPLRKTIELDMDKVKDSKEQLEETVDMINDYIGNEDEVEELAIQKEISEEKHDNNSELKHGEFLESLLDLGTMDVEEGKKIAMDNGILLNAFISDVNQELYEYTQDQTIMIEDDYIKIDDFYVDMVKELLMNEK